MAIGEFHAAFIDFHHDEIHRMDDEFHEHSNNSLRIKSMLCDLIRFHISAKE